MAGRIEQIIGELEALAKAEAEAAEEAGPILERVEACQRRRVALRCELTGLVAPHLDGTSLRARRVDLFKEPSRPSDVRN